MTSITDHFRDQFQLLLAYQADELPRQPVIALPATPAGAHERHLSCSMQQLRSSLSEVARILNEKPKLARQWRGELLSCGRDINFAINLTTSRMHALGIEEHQGSSP